MNYRELVNPDLKDVSPLPVPDKLGQLYTGQPFVKDAPWRTFDALPEAAWLNHINLRSANPPPQALFQMQVQDRPGNSTGAQIPGITTFVGDKDFGPFNVFCMPCLKKTSCDCSYDCPCKADICAEQKVEVCPCKEYGCPIKYIPIN